jgi:hypothetical protein
MKTAPFRAFLFSVSCSVLLAFGVVTAPTEAQSFFGSVIGNVADASGAVVPGAKVIIQFALWLTF